MTAPGLGCILVGDGEWSFIPTETITDGSGNAYRLGSTPTGLPIVKSLRSGKLFMLHTEDLIELAKRAGVDNTHTIEENNDPSAS